jgi:hypothetical protein
MAAFTAARGMLVKLHGLTPGGPVGLTPRSHQEAAKGALLMAPVGSNERD